MNHNQTLFAGHAHELAISFEVPGIVLRQIEPAQPVPCDSLATALPRHLKERPPHVAVRLPEQSMLIAAMLIPKPRNRLVNYAPPLLRMHHHLVQIFRKTRSSLTRHEARNARSAGSSRIQRGSVRS